MKAPISFLLCVGLLASTVVAAEPYPSDLIAAATKPFGAGQSYPALPSLSTRMQGQVGNEIAASPAIRAAFVKLDTSRRNTDWFAGIKALEQEKAVWCLQAALCHPHPDVQIHALRALGQLKDPKAVPFLLLYADYMAEFVEGSESATIHDILQEDIAKTLSALTGIEISIEGQDSEGLRKAIRRWARWELDQPPK